jgi:hypothetical protein
VDNNEDAPTFLEVTNEVGKISSGWNNVTKAKLALETRKRFDQYGSAIDSDVTPVEAVMSVFGFGTSSTRDMYNVSQNLSGDIKSHQKDVLQVYNDVKRYYEEKLQTENVDINFVQKVTGNVLNIYKNDPEALRIIERQMKLDFQSSDSKLINLFMRRAGIEGATGLTAQIKQMPVDEATKEQMYKYVEDMSNIHDQTKGK